MRNFNFLLHLFFNDNIWYLDHCQKLTKMQITDKKG